MDSDYSLCPKAPVYLARILSLNKSPSLSQATTALQPWPLFVTSISVCVHAAICFTKGFSELQARLLLALSRF